MELFAGIAALTSIIGYLGFQVYNEVKGFAELDAVSFLENNATVEPLEFPLNIDKPVEQVVVEENLEMKQLVTLVKEGKPFLRLMDSDQPLRILLSAAEMAQLRKLIKDQEALDQALQNAMNLLREHIVLPGKDEGALAKFQGPQLGNFLNALLKNKILRIEPGEEGQNFFVVDLRLFQEFLGRLRGLKRKKSRVEELPDEDEEKPEEVPPVPVVSESESDDDIVVVVPVVVRQPEEPVAVGEGPSVKIESSATTSTVSVALLAGIALAIF